MSQLLVKYEYEYKWTSNFEESQSNDKLLPVNSVMNQQRGQGNQLGAFLCCLTVVGFLIFTNIIFSQELKERTKFRTACRRRGMTIKDCHRAALNNQTAAAPDDEEFEPGNGNVTATIIISSNVTTDEEFELNNGTATITISSNDYSPYPDKSNYEYEW